MKKILIGILIAALMCFTLVACGETDSDLNADTGNGDNTEIVDGDGNENDNTDDDGNNGNVEDDSEDAEEEVVDAWKVSFTCDEHVTLYVYETSTMSGDGKQTSVAYSRDADTGAYLHDKKGQVNFKLEIDSGYDLAAIDITGDYDNVKCPDQTGIEDGYRITKIETDLVVNVILRKEGETEENDATQGYTVTFAGEHIKVYVYNTQDTTAEVEPTTTAYSRESDYGWLLYGGNGQVNFKIVCDDGYQLESIQISGTYKNNKVIDADNYIYRITKIKSDLTVTITATKIAED